MPFDSANMEGIKIFEKLSENSKCVIHKGKNLLTKKAVVLKEIKITNWNEGIPPSTIREISILKELRHNNINRLKNVFINEMQVYLMFDHIALDLKTYIRRLPIDFQLSKFAIQSYLYQIASAIEYCHRRRIFHRNLCPQNILLNRKGTVKITNFEAAQSFGLTRKVYTPSQTNLYYRSPEALLGTSRYSPAIDNWSIGCIFAEMFLLKPLFQGDSDINQLRKIVEIIGYTETSGWADIEILPHYCAELKAIRENKLKACFKNIQNIEAHLMKKMLKFNPHHRISAKRTLEHQYFAAFNPNVRVPTIF